MKLHTLVMMKVRVAATYVIRKFDSKVIVIVFDLYRDHIAFIFNWKCMLIVIGTNVIGVMHRF